MLIVCSWKIELNIARFENGMHCSAMHLAAWPQNQSVNGGVNGIERKTFHPTTCISLHLRFHFVRMRLNIFTVSRQIKVKWKTSNLCFAIRITAMAVFYFFFGLLLLMEVFERTSVRLNVCILHFFSKPRRHIPCHRERIHKCENVCRKECIGKELFGFFV